MDEKPIQAVGAGATPAEDNRISIDEFMKVELRVAKVLEAEAVPKSKKLVKLKVDVGTEQILGFTALMPEAGEVMAAVQMAMLGRLPYTTVREAIFSHPTLSEGLNQLFASWVQ